MLRREWNVDLAQGAETNQLIASAFAADAIPFADQFNAPGYSEAAARKHTEASAFI